MNNILDIERLIKKDLDACIDKFSILSPRIVADSIQD